MEQLGRRIFAVPSPPCEICGTPDCDDPPIESWVHFAEGDYGSVRITHADRLWLCFPPGGSLGALRDHHVEEHEDGTITVEPSILEDPSTFSNGWHGWLKRGIWSW